MTTERARATPKSSLQPPVRGKANSSDIEERQRDRCFQCNRSKATCFCGFVRPFKTRTHFVILMHPKEYKHEKVGTGRLTKLSLPNSEIITTDDLPRNRRLNELLADSCFHPVLLYPGPDSVNLSENGTLAVPERKELLVLVIDGTWSLAKKMMRLATNLHSLPRVCFTPSSRSRFLIKQQPHEHCLSTIEAVYFLLDVLDRQGYERLEGRHAVLPEILDKIVAFQIKCAADPNLPSYRHKKNYTAAENRKPAKKWETRSLYFRGNGLIPPE